MENGCLTSKSFHIWNPFLDDILPILIDLTRLHCEGAWNLHVSVVRRALALFFAFNRSHYSRWYPLYFEDCLGLKSTYPDIFHCFIKKGFLVAQIFRKGSRIPRIWHSKSNTTSRQRSLVESLIFNGRKKRSVNGI